MQLALILLPLVLKYGPEWVMEVVTLIHADKEPTAADWHDLLAKASKKSFDDYMNESADPAKPSSPAA